MVAGSFAAAVAGSASTQASQIGSLNRTSWGNDIKIKQSQRFHLHGLLVRQANMFREDVRDLTRTANSQQHNYVIVGTLVLGYAFRLLTNEMPPSAPEFMDVLFYLCTSIAFLYLVLGVLCGLCSIQLSMNCERDMLTGSVRLPIDDMVGEVLETGWQSTMEGFEHQSLSTILRIPGLSRLRGVPPSAPIEWGAGVPSNADAPPTAPRCSPPSESQSVAPCSSPEGAGPGKFNYVTLEYLGECCKAHRREFYMKEAEWTSISKYSPVFILWGMENVLFAVAYYQVSEYYRDGESDGYILQVFFVALAVLLSVVYNSYTSSTVGRSSPIWGIVDISMILLAASLCTFANLAGGDRNDVTAECAVEVVFACHFVKHACQAVKLLRGSEASDASSGGTAWDACHGGPPQRAGGSTAPGGPLADASLGDASLGTRVGIRAKPRAETGRLNRAIQVTIVCSTVIVSLAWVGSGVHQAVLGTQAWSDCTASGCHLARGSSRTGLARRLRGGAHLPGQALPPRSVLAAGSAVAEAVVDDELVLVAMNFPGGRKLVRHPGSTLASEVVDLHPEVLPRLKGSSFATISDGRGIELGRDVPLRAAAHSMGARAGDALELFVAGGA